MSGKNTRTAPPAATPKSPKVDPLAELRDPQRMLGNQTLLEGDPFWVVDRISLYLRND